MKKLTRKSLEEMAKTLSVLDEEEQRYFIGAGKESCVFNCFDYLDGDRHSANYYYQETKSNLGYEPTSNGGVSASDITKIGSFGGFEVKELSTPPVINSEGLANGCHIMMTFRKGDIDHAVIIEGFTHDNQGNLEIKYYDPTTGEHNKRSEGDYARLYSVKDISTSSSTSGSSGSGTSTSNY